MVPGPLSQMTKEIVSSVLWLLGAICILVVPGFVVGKTKRLDHVSFDSKNVRMGEHGFYTPVNFTTTGDSKLYSVSSLPAC